MCLEDGWFFRGVFFCLFVVKIIISIGLVSCSGIQIVLHLFLFFCTSHFVFLKPIPSSSLSTSNREQHSVRQVNIIADGWQNYDVSVVCLIFVLTDDFSMRNIMLTKGL